MRGTFVDGCSYSAPCACDLIGQLSKGCQGFGALVLGKGSSYRGVDLSSAKIVYAEILCEWVRIYIDAKNEKQKSAALEFTKEYYKNDGKLEASTSARIDLDRKNRFYTIKVNCGEIMSFTTEPILGGDKKTPIVYNNTPNMLYPTNMQGRTNSGMFRDGDRTFQMKNSNAFFNAYLRSEGSFE